MKWLSLIFIMTIFIYTQFFMGNGDKKDIPKDNIPTIKIDEDISEFYDTEDFKKIFNETKSLEEEIDRILNPNRETSKIVQIDFVNFLFNPNTPKDFMALLNKNLKFKINSSKKIVKKRKKILIAVKEKKKNIVKKKIRKKTDSNKLRLAVNIASQRLKVYIGNKLLYNWKISSGKRGYNTPRGRYKPQSIEKMHYSRKYNNAPMPYSIFFRGGYAFHGTKATHRLGRRASHGCIRLKTSNAKKLFYLVKKVGKSNSFVHIY
ncbi:hypothetical protein MNB_SV-15-187 [hydrothermal vent metagenome]|uniref:L,D-TPase catalytic domain-containing protein n=1 Tax=hydrothermal vent metagenome TaxID=652676 RepID=A0A1W1EJI5_9ZZZZ